MIKFKALLAGAVLAGLGGGAMAETLACTFPKQGLNSWIRGQIIVTYDPVAKTATVFDSLINQELGAPMAATVSTDNAKRLTLRWKLRNVQTRIGFAPSINYALTYLKANGTANVSANAPMVEEYTKSPFTPGQYSARGACTPR